MVGFSPTFLSVLTNAPSCQAETQNFHIWPTMYAIWVVDITHSGQFSGTCCPPLPTLGPEQLLVLGTRHSSSPQDSSTCVDPPFFYQRRSLSSHTQFSTNIKYTRMFMPLSGIISLKSWLLPRANVLNWL